MWMEAKVFEVHKHPLLRSERVRDQKLCSRDKLQGEIESLAAMQKNWSQSCFIICLYTYFIT